MWSLRRASTRRDTTHSVWTGVLSSAVVRAASPSQHVWSSGLLCCWSTAGNALLDDFLDPERSTASSVLRYNCIIHEQLYSVRYRLRSNTLYKLTFDTDTDITLTRCPQTSTANEKAWSKAWPSALHECDVVYGQSASTRSTLKWKINRMIMTWRTTVLEVWGDNQPSGHMGLRRKQQIPQ